VRAGDRKVPGYSVYAKRTLVSSEENQSLPFNKEGFLFSKTLGSLVSTETATGPFVEGDLANEIAQFKAAHGVGCEQESSA
jgi:hypothetical protein